MIQEVLKDFVLFLGTGREIGTVQSYKPPALKIIEEDVRLAGMNAPIAVDMGMEKLTTEWTINLSRDVLAQWGLSAGSVSTLTLRGATQDTNGLVKPVIHKMRGNVRSVEQSEWQPGQRATMTVMMSLTYFQVTHGLGLPPVIEVDVENYVRLINGIDHLAGVRAAIGR